MAVHCNVDIKIVQGDMRDLSQLKEAAFDIVYHGYSLGFVPNARIVFQQVARVLRHGGLYHFMCANPFYLGMQETDWNGEGYTIKHQYVNGPEITYEDQEWVYDRSQSEASIPPPREFRHTLCHFVSIAPPWLSFWSSYRPDVLSPAG